MGRKEMTRIMMKINRYEGVIINHLYFDPKNVVKCGFYLSFVFEKFWEKGFNQSIQKKCWFPKRSITGFFYTFVPKMFILSILEIEDLSILLLKKKRTTKKFICKVDLRSDYR